MAARHGHGWARSSTPRGAPDSWPSASASVRRIRSCRTSPCTASTKASPPRGPARRRHSDGHPSRQRLVLVHPDHRDDHERRRRGAAIGLQGRGAADAEETLVAFPDRDAGCRQLVANATPVSPARFDADYSYLHSRHAGDRFVLVGDAGAFLDPIFSTGVLLAMQSGIEAAEVVSAGLRDGDLRARRFAGYERRLVRRYHHFRRFAVGFYNPAFRDLFFSPSSRFGIYEAVLSVLSGNWRPSWKTRLRLYAFFVLVALQRFIPLAPHQQQPVPLRPAPTPEQPMRARSTRP